MFWSEATEMASETTAKLVWFSEQEMLGMHDGRAGNRPSERAWSQEGTGTEWSNSSQAFLKI